MAQTKRRTSEPSVSRKTASGKQSVPEPTGLQHFLVILLMHICKKILLVQPSIKVFIYAIGTSAGSLFTDLVPVKQTYFSNKQNLLNTCFVKLGWGWTLSLMIPFIYYTSFIYSAGRTGLIRNHLSRLGVATFWWYFCTKSFNWIENATGMCSSAQMEHDNKKVCREAGHDWIGFDISGHTFLLIHCLLVISEEVRCLEGWNKITEIIKQEEENLTRLRSEEELSLVKTSYENYNPKIKCLIVGLTGLQLLWEVMLLSTILYFHNMPQKLLATAFAGVYWLFFYQVWFPSSIGLPIAPGKGAFRYIV